jgi:hypothetical protein
MSSRKLARRGWPSSVQVTSGDLVIPRIERFSAGLASATADGGARFRARAVVDGRGLPVRDVHVALYRRGSTGYHTSPLTLVRGTAAGSGTWRGTARVTRCASAGEYRVAVVARGQAWTQRTVTAERLVQIGGPATVSMPWLPGDDAEPVARLLQAAPGHLAVRFSEGVRNVLPALEMRDSETGVLREVASVTCATAEGLEAPCSGGDAVVRRVDFMTREVLGRAVTFTLSRDPIVPQITDGAGNPVRSVT